MPKYDSPPQLSQWKKDTSPSPANAAKEGEMRAKDPILTRLDQVIDSYHKHADHGKRWFLITDMFFCTDYWLKRLSQKMGAGILDPAREPAIYALFVGSANWLCTLFNCTINVLPRELEKAFGRELGYHGQHIDSRPGVAQYLTRAEAAQYRLMFKDGKAWQLPWWSWWRKKIVLAESSRSKGTYNPKAQMKDPMFGPNYSGFVMSMGRDIYMAPHFGCYNKENFFHSSYLSGDTVMCAGSMLIQGGVIKAIKTDSGHYRPTAQHVVNLLQTLQMLAVPLDIITVTYFDPKTNGWRSVNGQKLLNVGGNYDRITEGQKQFDQHAQARKAHKN